VAKAALHAERRLAASDGGGVSRRMLRISFRPSSATPTAAAAGLLDTWGCYCGWRSLILRLWLTHCQGGHGNRSYTD